MGRGPKVCHEAVFSVWCSVQSPGVTWGRGGDGEPGQERHLEVN